MSKTTHLLYLTLLPLFVIVLAVCLVCLGVPVDSAQSSSHRHDNRNFYPYGPDFGDHRLVSTDDGSSDEIPIRTRLVFFDNTYDSLWVNHNGIITTSGPFYTYTSAPFPLSTGNPGIAPYWTDIDISNAHNMPERAIFYRQDTSEATLRRATGEVMASYGEEVPDFEATWTLIVTWYTVSYYGNNGATQPTPVVTFQCILVSDGVHSFALHHYGQIDWTAGGASGADEDTGLGGTAAQVGFDAGDGINYYNMPGSQTDIIKDEVQGKQFAYRIDRAEIQDPETPVDTSCTAGTYSTHGEEPCLLCEIGYYQDRDGQRFCHLCPTGTTTSELGTTSVFECYTPGIALLDPHFMITDPLTQEHFCFDYTGSNDQILDLVMDEETGIFIDGKLFAVSDEHPDVTYFASIQIRTDDVMLEFDREHISISSEKLEWTAKDYYKGEDLMVLPVEGRNETYMVDMTTDSGRVSVIVYRHDGPVAGEYLGIYLAHVDGLSDDVFGLLGQFVHSNFITTEKDGQNYATMMLRRGDITVPVVEQMRYSPTAHGRLPCWLYAGNDVEAELL